LLELKVTFRYQAHRENKRKITGKGEGNVVRFTLVVMDSTQEESASASLISSLQNQNKNAF
jgi:hypothetical protein